MSIPTSIPGYSKFYVRHTSAHPSRQVGWMLRASSQNTEELILNAYAAWFDYGHVWWQDQPSIELMLFLNLKAAVFSAADAASVALRYSPKTRRIKSYLTKAIKMLRTGKVVELKKPDMSSVSQDTKAMVELAVSAIENYLQDKVVVTRFQTMGVFEHKPQMESRLRAYPAPTENDVMNAILIRISRDR